MALARKLQANGKVPEACDVLIRVAKGGSASAELFYDLGRMQKDIGRFQDASENLDHAARLEPQEAVIWQSWGELLSQSDDPSLVKAAQDRLAQVEIPEDRRQDFRALLAADKQASPAMPESAEDLRLQAKRLLDAGEAHSAMDVAQRAANMTPHDAATLELLGQACFDARQYLQSLRAFESVRKLGGVSPQLLIKIAKCLQELKLPKSAFDILEECLALSPGFAPASRMQAEHYFERKEFSEALMALRSAPSHQEAPVEEAVLEVRILRALNRIPAALNCLDGVSARFPEDAGLFLLKGQLLQSAGQFSEAREAIEASIAIDPTNGQGYRALAMSHQFTADDPLIGTLERLWKGTGLSIESRAAIGFALAKAMEDCGQHERVFSYLESANKLARVLTPSDTARWRQDITDAKAFYAGFAPAGHALENTDENFAPVFVTGLPRSGTTLVEQIIASHPQMSGGGEIDRLPRTIHELLHEKKLSHIDDVSLSQIRELAEDYKQHLGTKQFVTSRVTDKSLQSWQHLGLIWLIFPKARVIVVRRDPRDNLFSIYKNMFGVGSHGYASDLDDLATHYQMFDDMIAFWREIAPDRITEMQYEDLVANPEAQSQLLIESAGLEWHENCLRFYENRRQIDTLSVYQARQPLYDSSVGSWKMYPEQMKKLNALIG